MNESYPYESERSKFESRQEVVKKKKKIHSPFAADHGAQNRIPWRYLVRVTAANVPLIYLQVKPSAAHIHLPVKSTVLIVPLIYLQMEPPAAHNHLSKLPI